MDGSRPAAKETSFGKGLSVLSWILDHDGQRADDIATGLGLPVSSVYRFLRALRAVDFVTENDGTYTPGPRIASPGGSHRSSSIASMAAPFLDRLAAVTGETAVLTVRQGLHAVCVRQVESIHQIKLAFQLGQLLPLYAGAGQRVLLAFAPEEIQRAVLQGGQRPFTPETPTRAELTRQLSRIRHEGVAISRAELIPGSFAIAMPVLKAGVAIAGVCLAGPRGRCGQVWQALARRELADAVQSMNQMVGGAA